MTLLDIKDIRDLYVSDIDKVVKINIIHPAVSLGFSPFLIKSKTGLKSLPISVATSIITSSDVNVSCPITDVLSTKDNNNNTFSRYRS